MNSKFMDNYKILLCPETSVMWNVGTTRIRCIFFFWKEFHSLIIPNFMRVKKKKKEIENDNML